MATAKAKPKNDITQCPKCTKVYTDPRILPCTHTYCLKCIEAWSKNKQPGDNLACPLCWKEFSLPRNGVSDLPKNFFVANYLRMIELSVVENKAKFCEICTGGDESDEKKVVALVFCVECQMKLCKNCERGHKAIKLTSSHKLVEIGGRINVEKLYRSMPPPHCDQHQEECLKMYCFDCRSAVCIICCVKSHRDHKYSGVYEAAEEFRKQMTSDVGNVAAGIDNCRDMLERLEKERKDFMQQVLKTQNEINTKAEQLKKMVDDHKDKLLAELALMKEKRMKEIERLREEIERQLLSMESYKKYVDEVREKGTACDVARAASDLHDRADELLTFDETESSLANLGHAKVTFTSSNFVVDDVKKTTGQLQLATVKTGEPVLVTCTA